MIWRSVIWCLVTVLLLGWSGRLVAQADSLRADTLQRATLLTEAADSIASPSDTLQAMEDAPLDIAQDRGLYILTPDRRMQLRILGSVRYLVVFDAFDLETKQAFHTVEIPTGDSRASLPNYYNALNQSRLGFEVTRAFRDKSFFIRLETDFAGPNGYRIRHAYAQFERFTFGQTWSLFAQVLHRPPTVSTGGPTGSISRRTPQLRYTPTKLLPRARFAVALEYSPPSVNLPDSASIRIFQLLPDLTARLNRGFDWGSVQVSGVFPFLSGRTADGRLIVRPGWGLSVGAAISSWLAGRWYLHLAGGRGIARFFNEIGDEGLDLLIDPERKNGLLPFTWGGYLGYRHQWSASLSSNIIVGRVETQSYTFRPEDSFHFGESLRVNTFWDVVEGARLGAELTIGRRVERSGTKGSASRLSLLFYYDF